MNMASRGMTLQGSLLDQIDEVGLRPLAGAVRRIPLTRGAWIDLRPGWLAGASALAGLSGTAPDLI